MIRRYTLPAMMVGLACFALTVVAEPFPRITMRNNADEILKAVTALVENGQSIEERDRDLLMTPLMWVASHGDQRSVKALLSAGANPNAISGSKQTALHYAMGNRNHSLLIIQALLNRGADPNLVGGTVFTEALNSSAVFGVFKALVASGFNVDQADRPGYTPVVYAAGKGRADVVELLLLNGANPDTKIENGHTPLMSAAGSAGNADSINTVRLLLDAGLDARAVTKDRRTPIHYAARSGGPMAGAIIRLLADAGADVNASTQYGLTPLMMAVVRSEHPDTVKVLVQRGADANASDVAGNSVLAYAVGLVQGRPRSSSSIRTILQSKVDVNTANKLGWTPLMQAARSTLSDTVALLLHEARDIDVNARNNDGWTALMIAVASSDPKIHTKWIVAATGLRSQDRKKEEISLAAKKLSYLAAIGRLQRVWHLLQHGADPSIAADDGTNVYTILKDDDDMDSKAILRLINLKQEK